MTAKEKDTRRALALDGEHGGQGVETERTGTFQPHANIIQSDGFAVTLSAHAYARKPTNWGAVTKHVKAQRPQLVTCDELLDYIGRGFVWCGACHDHFGWGEEHFASMQVFGVDVDNATEVLDEHGQPVKDADGHKLKRALRPDEEGYLAPLDGIRCAAKLKEHIEPLCCYATFNNRYGAGIDPADEWPRFRLVFALPEPVTVWADACDVLDFLLDEFSQADHECRNPTRLFAGAQRGGVIPLRADYELGVNQTEAGRTQEGRGGEGEGRAIIWTYARTGGRAGRYERRG